jgi:hypothetical protein
MQARFKRLPALAETAVDQRRHRPHGGGLVGSIRVDNDRPANGHREQHDGDDAARCAAQVVPSQRLRLASTHGIPWQGLAVEHATASSPRRPRALGGRQKKDFSLPAAALASWTWPCAPSGHAKAWVIAIQTAAVLSALPWPLPAAATAARARASGMEATSRARGNACAQDFVVRG